MKVKVNKLAVVLALLVGTVTPALAQSYQVNKDASTIKWTGKKVAGSIMERLLLKKVIWT